MPGVRQTIFRTVAAPLDAQYKFFASWPWPTFPACPLSRRCWS